MENDKIKIYSKQHLVGIDLFRITAVIVVFLFHSKIHLGCDYGIEIPL